MRPGIWEAPGRGYIVLNFLVLLLLLSYSCLNLSSNMITYCLRSKVISSFLILETFVKHFLIFITQIYKKDHRKIFIIPRLHPERMRVANLHSKFKKKIKSSPIGWQHSVLAIYIENFT